MIIRIYRVKVAAGREKEWQDRVERLAIPWLRSLPGLRAFLPGKPPEGNNSRTFCMVMLWDRLDSVVTALGVNWERRVFIGDGGPLVEKSELEHFEIYPSELTNWWRETLPEFQLESR